VQKTTTTKWLKATVRDILIELLSDSVC